MELHIIHCEMPILEIELQNSIKVHSSIIMRYIVYL